MEREDPDAAAIARQLQAHHIPAEQAKGIAEAIVQSTLEERSLMQAVMRSEIERAVAPLADALADNTAKLAELEAKLDINIARLDAKIETSVARLAEKTETGLARLETKILWMLALALLQTGFLAGLTFTLLK